MFSISIAELGAFAIAKRDSAGSAGHWSGTALELWLCLFFEHRRARHSGEPEDYEAGSHPMRDALCQGLRAALQRLSASERRQITRLLSDASRPVD